MSIEQTAGGIYISGLEMPKYGGKIITIYADGRVLYDGGYLEAVSVPPHGRLIDEDELGDCDMYEAELDRVGYSLKAIQMAPTCIPADKMIVR